MAEPVLSDGQFSLSEYRFGGEADPLVVVPGGLDIGVTGWRTQDSPNPVHDSTLFGRDRLTPGSWTFSMTTNEDFIDGTLDAIEALAQVWQAEEIRDTPGAVLPLRYNIGGRTRRVYGRPRRFAPSLQPLAWQGVTPVLCDFALADTLYYDDNSRAASLSITPAVRRGLKAPLVGPLSSVASGEEKIVALSDIGGTAPAPFTALIHGPIQNPYLSEDGWRIDIATTLAYDQFLVVDTRPWAKTVLRSDGASLAGALSRTSDLTAARLQPGGSTLRFGGKDATGTAYVDVTWRPTFLAL